MKTNKENEMIDYEARNKIAYMEGQLVTIQKELHNLISRLEQNAVEHIRDKIAEVRDDIVRRIVGEPKEKVDGGEATFTAEQVDAMKEKPTRYKPQRGDTLVFYPHDDTKYVVLSTYEEYLVRGYILVTEATEDGEIIKVYDSSLRTDAFRYKRPEVPQ